MFYSKKFKKLKEVKHCFFSRKNGFSKGIYKGLNCGKGSKDNKKNINKNLNFVAKKMKFTQQSDLYLRIKRLLSPKYMGELFKVILAYRSDNNNFAGFK